MTMYMINVRMRRIEAINKHTLWRPDCQYKAYQGTRMWTLRDDQVHHTITAALRSLKLELERIRMERTEQLNRLNHDISLIESDLYKAIQEEA